MQSRLQPRKSVRTVKLRPRPCLRRHAVRCRLGIADRQAEKYHRKRCPDETEAVVRDFKLRFGSFVNQVCLKAAWVAPGCHHAMMPHWVCILDLLASSPRSRRTCSAVSTLYCCGTARATISVPAHGLSTSRPQQRRHQGRVEYSTV